MKSFIYARLLILPSLVIIGYIAGGWWNYLTPVTCFGIHPIINLLQKKRIVLHHDQTVHSTNAFRFIEMMYVPVIVGLTIWALYQSRILSGPAFTGLAISVGMINGILGFTLAHELIHRKKRKENLAGHILLLNVLYMHYSIEHIWGHHVYASTPKDPHTACVGQSLYRFLPHAILRTFINACEIENKILKRYQHRWASIHNRILSFSLLQITLVVFILFFYGLESFTFFFLQSVVAIFLLHTVNYLQHYGLFRKESNPGFFEKMNVHHAWGSGNKLNNFSLFQLENHAHHHMHPTHPYESLKETDESPQHPTGYSGMIMLALIPPLWFRIVHKRFLSTN